MFIAKNNDLIVLVNESREVLEEQLQFMVYTSIEETNLDYELYNGSYLTKEEVAVEEQKRINKLTMTALDFIKVLRGFGLSLEEVTGYINSNLELETQMKYCQNVYCGVVRQLLPLTIGEITITDEMIVEAFEEKMNKEVE